MANEYLSNLITDLCSRTEANSITPAALGNVLQQMVSAIDSIGSQQTLVQEGEFYFGSLKGVRVPGATETELIMNEEGVHYNSTRELIQVGIADGSPFITALVDCMVCITGQVNLQPVSSYSADRVLRWFKIDEEGERYADSIMTTHFTGVTQIFNIPVNYSCMMFAGQTLYLTAYASGSNESIVSENSRINIHAYSKSV